MFFMSNKETEKLMQNLWNDLIKKLSETSSEEAMRKILEKLITKDEKDMILKRLAVVSLVRSGKTYREIGEILWLSPTTVSTIKKNVLDVNKNYKSYRHFYSGPAKWSAGPKIKIQKNKGLFDGIDLWDLFLHPPRPAGMGLLSSSGIPERPWSKNHHRRKK
jgi:Trp operon repressor